MRRLRAVTRDVGADPVACGTEDGAGAVSRGIRTGAVTRGAGDRACVRRPAPWRITQRLGPGAALAVLV